MIFDHLYSHRPAREQLAVAHFYCIRYRRFSVRQSTRVQSWRLAKLSSKEKKEKIHNNGWRTNFLKSILKLFHNKFRHTRSFSYACFSFVALNAISNASTSTLTTLQIIFPTNTQIFIFFSLLDWRSTALRGRKNSPSMKLRGQVRNYATRDFNKYLSSYIFIAKIKFKNNRCVVHLNYLCQ